MCASIELNNYSQLKKSTDLQLIQVFGHYQLLHISFISNHGISFIPNHGVSSVVKQTHFLAIPLHFLITLKTLRCSGGLKYLVKLHWFYDATLCSHLKKGGGLILQESV